MLDPVGHVAEKQLAGKEQQIQALRYIVQGQNLICSLPTGYGKSHIFAIAPFMFDRVRVLIVFMCINNDMYLFY